MFRVNDLSVIDVRGLPCDVFQWEFFDVAPFDAPCCGLSCVQGLTSFTFSYVSAWGDIVVHACSAACVVERIKHELNKVESLEIVMNAAYTLIPVGEFGSYRVIKPKQVELF